MGGSRGGAWLLLFLALASVFVSVRGLNVTVNGTVPATGNATTNATANATAPVYPYCAGVEVIYELTSVTRIPINASTPATQPYGFESTLTVNNAGYSTVETWGVGLTWPNQVVSFSSFFWTKFENFPLNFVVLDRSKHTLRLRGKL